jgi:hypothetical protein
MRITITADSLRLALPHVSTEASRPIINALCVESAGAIVATNGRTLAAIPAAATFGEDDALFAPTDTAVLIRFHKPREATARKVEAIRFDSDGTPTTGIVVTLLSSYGQVIGATLADIIEGPFPTWRQVVPASTAAAPVSILGLSPDVVARFEAWGMIALTLHGPSGAAIVRAHSHPEAFGLLMPASGNGVADPDPIPAWVAAPVWRAPSTL